MTFRLGKMILIGALLGGLAPVKTNALTTNELGAGHQVKLTVHRGFLPGIPVLARVEVLNSHGVERDLWDAEVSLSSDTAGAILSTNRLTLRNGAGSTLVSFNDTAWCALTATVGSLSASRSLTNRSSEVASTNGGTLASSATWSGVVIVTNDVTVPSGSKLTIASNTLVLLNGATSGTTAPDFLISGAIESLGTEDYPVEITCNSVNLAARWGQIRHNTAQPSVYRYTSITRAGRAASEGHTATAPVLRPSNSTIRMEYCNVTDLAEQNRSASGFGGPGKVAVAAGSDLTLIGCLFQRARMGPEISTTALACTNSWFLDMRGPDDSDGIYLHNQSAGQLVTLSGCVVANGDDDGIDTLDSTITVENCIVRGWNSLLEDAKGISVFNGATHVSRSLFVGCTVAISAKWSGGPATLVTINNSTFNENLTNVLANIKANAPGPFIDYRITNSVLWGPDAVQSDFGPTNFTIRYSDISEPWPGEGNIQADPLFVDALAHDYRLQTHSPCIDSGAPSTTADSDASRADMGWRAFNAAPPELSAPGVAQPSGAMQFVLAAYTNREYVVEASSALTNWTAIATNRQTTENMLITDPALPGTSARFYRVRPTYIPAP